MATGGGRWGRGRRLSDLGEAALLARLARLLRRPAAGVRLGVGDDAAVLAAAAGELVWTVDTLVEEVDFRRRWAAPADVGHKAAAVNLSDLAAMAARPRGLLLAIAARPQEAAVDLVAIARAVDRVGRAHGAPLVGGDLSATAGPLVITVTAVGEVAARRALVRGGGRPGDLVAVTGELGAAAAGLALLDAGAAGHLALKRAQLRPAPQVALGQALARLPRGVVRACIDVSDGLARDAARLAAPGAGVLLAPGRLPLPAEVVRLVGRREAARLALCGGEDLVLALALAPAKRAALADALEAAGGTLHVVGRVTRGRGVALDDCAGARPTLHADGFDHFRAGD